MTEPQEPRSASPEHPAPEELSELAFSPEAAAAGLREHVAGCLTCTAQVAELRAVLTALAQLPEPPVPVSVGIRLDAAIARAWQEAEVRPEPVTGTSLGTAAGSTSNRRSRPWRKVVLPVGALCLFALGVVGAAKLAGGAGASGGSATSAAGRSVPAPALDTALTQWVRSVLPNSAAPNSPRSIVPQGSVGSPDHSAVRTPQCAAVPARPGYNLLTTSQREFSGRPATLVVYQDGQEPASRPLFAVVYAGSSCPTASSSILDEGFVSR